MIQSKLYKYSSTAEEHKGEDFSAHIQLGDVQEDNLTEVLGTIELTLAGLPISEEFAPETLFVYERLDISSEGTLLYRKTWDVCVQEDVVSQPILSDDNYYDHHITLVEVSAIAQKRLVDNIAVTYRLQDVTVDGETVINTETKAKCSFQGAKGTPSSIGATYDQFEVDTQLHAQITLGKNLTWNFCNWLPLPNYGSKLEWTQFKYYQPVPVGQTIQVDLPVPLLKVMNGVQGGNTFSDMGYASVRTIVTETDLRTNEQALILDQTTHPSTSVQHENWVTDWAKTDLGIGEIVGRIELYNTGNPIQLGTTYYTTKIGYYQNEVANRRIQFTARKNCRYNIKVVPLNNFNYVYNQESENFFFVWTITDPKYKQTNSSSTYASMEFVTYQSGDETRVMFKSAPEQNAYDLFQKAQISTQDVNKVNGVAIGETPQTFYVADDDKLMLQNTKIVENFYNQKNWWEMLLEIGKYIHSIPIIKFGDSEHSDQFVVQWRKLGLTDEHENQATKISIFNSRSIENYISACSSYITNMIQLGGIIDEWVAPKSSSEDYLVYNDVAEIHTSKPIIEIVDMQVKNIKALTLGGVTIPVGTVAELVNVPTGNGYVFEQSVYNLFSLNGTQKANKGLAIYYELGTNIIKGLNYRLPSVSSGDAVNDYAIKRILGTVYGVNPNYWVNIKVNDFVFHIVYRTKDTARSDQTRPDLRKYLLTSIYDKVPQHYQFNNQTDVVVDSTKFGNNIYGKLIRTGNAEYTTTEWVESTMSTKQVGDLYNIRGERYYVATVKNTNYGTHIISEVTFSKDYNQLSEIIGIPSEPRFYEISERNIIDREKPINEYMILGTRYYTTDSSINYRGYRYLADLLFRNEANFPKYAITVFKNDIDKVDLLVEGNEMFYKDVCHPISAYSIQNTLTLEWDMVDNFSAGDKVEPTNAHSDNSRPVDTAYNTLNPVQYVDAHGRSDLFDFLIMKDLNLNSDQIISLPDSPVRTRIPYGENYIGKIVGSGNDWDMFAAATQFVYDNTSPNRYPIDGDCVNVEWTREDGVHYYLLHYSDNVWLTSVVDQYIMELIDSEQVDWNKIPLVNELNNLLFCNEVSYIYLGTNTRGLGLLKDNRETIHFNYNIQMISDSDRFVISSWLWQPEKGNLRLALLNKEINKISNDTISQDDVITDQYIIYAPDPNDPTHYIDNIQESGNPIKIPISTLLNGVDLTDVKAIAIISDVIVADDYSSGARYFVMGRNIGELDTSDITGTLTPEQAKEKAKADWYISNYDKSMFPHQ